MHVLLNEMKELASQKKVPHRDFYNIRKARGPALTWCQRPSPTVIGATHKTTHNEHINALISTQYYMIVNMVHI